MERGTLTIEAMDADPWNAVRLPLPDDPAQALAVSAQAHLFAEHCYEAALGRAEDPGGHWRNAFEPSRWPMEGGIEPEAAAELAEARLAVLEAINPSLYRTGPHSDLNIADGPDDLAERIGQLVTLTDTGQSRTHESYLENQALLSDASGRASSELGREALTTMRDAARQDYAAHLATVAAVRLDNHADPADAEAMQKEAAARREIAAGMRLDPTPEPPAPEPPNGDRPRGDFAKDSAMSGDNLDVAFEDATTTESMQTLAKIEREGGAAALIEAFKDGYTNWGKAQEATELAPGIYHITTAGHGGYYLSPERYAQMPEQLRECSFTKDRFFEEDSSRIAVELTFPTETESFREDAIQYYNECYLDELGPLDMSTLPPEAEPATLTLEAIQRNPINAVIVDLPDEPSRELLIDAYKACDAVHHHAQVVGHEDGLEMMCEERQSLIADLHAEKFFPTIVRAEGEPHALIEADVRWHAQEQAKAAGAEEGTVLTAEAIEANPWNAVYMKIDNPDLYQAAMATAERLADEAAKAWNTHGFNGDGFAADDAAERARSLAQAIENGRDPNPPEHEPPEPDNTPPSGGNSPKGPDMSGANPDIVFEANRESVQPGGRDYSALQQQPAPAVIEEEPPRQAVQVAAAELGEEQADPELIREAQRPDFSVNPVPVMGNGIGGRTLHTINLAQRDEGVTEAIEDRAVLATLQAPPVEHEPQQTELKATGAPEMTAEPQGQDTAQIDQAAPVAVRADQPSEEETHHATALRAAADESTKRQAAELPGAANTDDGRGASAEGASAPMSTQEKYAALLASFRAEHEGDAPADRAEDSGRGHESAPAAFRSFGR